MRICFYSPYLPDHAGGGEKHMLDVALVYVEAGHQVTIALPEAFTREAIRQLQQRLSAVFGHDLSALSWQSSPLFNRGHAIKKFRWTQRFDRLYYVTDGSLFISGAKRNILHVQIPFSFSLSNINRLKLKNWPVIQTNSAFTKSVIEKAWRIKVSAVVYPKVDSACFHTGSRRANSIVSVGRFFRQLHSKRQDVLIRALGQLIMKVPEARGWQLTMIGSVEDQEYFAELRQLAHGLPVRFVTNAARDDVLHAYQAGRIYWHAAGFEQNESKHPEKVEHFGISTVEAMASGLVPLAVGKGGQKEILSGALEDLTWQTVDELVTKTAILIRSKEYYEKYQRLVEKRATDFDEEHFVKNVLHLLEL